MDVCKSTVMYTEFIFQHTQRLNTEHCDTPGNEHVENNVTDEHSVDSTHVEWVFDGERLGSIGPLQTQLPLLKVGDDCHSQTKCSVGQKTES